MTFSASQYLTKNPNTRIIYQCKGSSFKFYLHDGQELYEITDDVVKTEFGQDRRINVTLQIFGASELSRDRTASFSSYYIIEALVTEYFKSLGLNNTPRLKGF